MNIKKNYEKAYNFFALLLVLTTPIIDASKNQLTSWQQDHNSPQDILYSMMHEHMLISNNPKFYPGQADELNATILAFVDNNKGLLNEPSIHDNQSLASICLNTQNFDLMLQLMDKFRTWVQPQTLICKRSHLTNEQRFYPLIETVTGALEHLSFNSTQKGRLHAILQILNDAQAKEIAQTEEICRSVHHLMVAQYSLPYNNLGEEINNDTLLNIITENPWLTEIPYVVPRQSLATLCINTERPNLLMSLMQKFPGWINRDTPIGKFTQENQPTSLRFIRALYRLERNLKMQNREFPSQPRIKSLQAVESIRALINSSSPSLPSRATNQDPLPSEHCQNPAQAPAARSSNGSSTKFQYDPYNPQKAFKDLSQQPQTPKH